MKKPLIFVFYLLLVVCPSVARDLEIAVFGINDFHAAFVRNDDKGIPGAAALVQTMDSLKALYPNNVVVSAGDNFGGSYFYTSTRRNCLIPQLFKDLGLNVSAVGNHEFDEGQEALKDCWRTHVENRPQSWNMTYVAANVRNAEGRVPDFCQPWTVQKVRLADGRDFHIAFIGLTTSNTPYQASPSKWKGLTFDGNYVGVLDSLKKLPEYKEVEQAHAKFVLSHVGTQMADVRRGDVRLFEPKWDDPEVTALKAIRGVDGFISGHTHERVCGYINDSYMPVAQAQNHGRYISVMTLVVDSATLALKEVQPTLVQVTPKTQLDVKAARLQAQIDEVLATTKTEAGYALGMPLTVCRETLVHDRDGKPYAQTPLGTLVTRSYAAAYRKFNKTSENDIILGVNHFLGIRSSITQGGVTVMDVGEILPFANELRAYDYTGKQLLSLVEFGHHNVNFGWLQTHDLIIDKDAKGHVKGLTYVFPDGRKRIITAKTKLVLIADEFITSGGDGYDRSFFPQSQRLEAKMPMETDAFIMYLKDLKEI